MSQALPRPALLSVCILLIGLTTSRAAEHVIHISVDGLNAAMMQQLIEEGKAPNFKRFQDEGVWTNNARTDHTYTVTLPNHTCMMTGRPVSRVEGMPNTVNHGWVENGSPKRGQTLHNGNPDLKYLPSVFDVVHDAGLSTALYTSKDKFEIYDISYDENHGAPNERGRDKIDVYYMADDGAPQFSRSVNERFLSDMANRHFNYVLIHYRDADTAGHALSWNSSAWYYALRNIDAYLGEVFRLVETDPALMGKTTIILNTDHGGTGFHHSEFTLPENYTIPVMVWGADVGRGDLYAINQDCRQDPGGDRVDYTAEKQPIRNGDTGNLALSLLGLESIPGSLMNAKQDLRVAMPGDYNLDGTVDAADTVFWRKMVSTNNPRADGNRDGKVDDADRELITGNFGAGNGKDNNTTE